MSIISYRHKIFLPAVPKIACTSLKQAFFKLENGFDFKDFSVRGRLYNVHNLIYPTMPFNTVDKSRFEGFHKLLLVRDPVARLVSFFNDKIVDKDCLRLWPTAGAMAGELSLNPDFDEFVKLLEEYRCHWPEVKHHTDSIFEFAGKPDWYDGVFSLDEMNLFSAKIEFITGLEFQVPRDNTSSGAVSVEMLSANTVRKAREFYLRDYKIFESFLHGNKLRSQEIKVNTGQVRVQVNGKELVTPKVGRKTFHVLGIPHTVTTKEYSVCAFTQKVLNLCRMLKGLGHEVIHYGHEDSDVACSEHVTVITRRDHSEAYGNHDWRLKGFPSFSSNDSVYRRFADNCIKEINQRKKQHDFLLCPYGGGHKAIGEMLTDMIVCEPGIGYPSDHFAPFKVFESYAVLHAYHGLKAVQSAKSDFWHDVVIPNYYDVSDFQYSSQKDDYMLFLGRVGLGKGVHVAIELANECKKKLVIAGPDAGNELSKLPGFRSEYVSHVGQVGPKQRAELLSRAKCVLAPSTFLEPFCGVHIEAMLSGTPVISTDWGAFAEYNLHGYTGYRCQTFDHFMWAIKNIDRIDPSYCHSWATNNFNLDRVAAMYDEYFENVWQVFVGRGWYAQVKDRQSLDFRKSLFPQ